MSANSSKRSAAVTPAADVDALIQGAGQGTRLGLGPKAFVSLGEQTLLERVVATMSAVAGRVIVAVPANDVGRANDLVGGPRVSVIAGGEQRVETFRKIEAQSTAPWLILHEVTHPLATVDLAARVLAAARRVGCAVAAVPNDVSIYGSDGVLRATPGKAMMLQKPIAFRKDAIGAGLRAISDVALAENLGVLEILKRGGVTVEFVLGSSANFKITTAADLALACAVALQERQHPS